MRTITDSDVGTDPDVDTDSDMDTNSEVDSSARTRRRTRTVTVTENLHPECKKCETPLYSGEDTQPWSGNFFKHCKICRDWDTEIRRDARQREAKRRASRLRRAIQANSTSSTSSRKTPRWPVTRTTERLHSARKTERLPSVRKKPNPSPVRTASRSSTSKSSFSKLFSKATNTNLGDNEQECTVCAENYPILEFPGLSTCLHPPDVCRHCFIAWLSGRIESTTWEQIKCPTQGCTNFISHDDVKKHATKELFARFDDLSIRSMLSNDPDFRYCLAAGCTSGQIHDEGVEGNIFCCGACGFRACTIHNVPFHTDETCAQYDERREREETSLHRKQNQASMAEVGRTSVECPGCGVNIQKTDGCDHMTCGRSQCRYEFCYICQAPYGGRQGIRRSGNSAHASRCEYHTSMLPAHPGDIEDDDVDDEEE